MFLTVFIVFQLFCNNDAVTRADGELVMGDITNGKSLFERSQEKTEIPAVPIVNECRAFMLQFAELAANFTRCSLVNARPMRLCENCSDIYKAASDVYDILTSSKMDCKRYEQDINGDQVQIILQTGDFIKSIWEEARCAVCFDESEFKSHKNWRKSNDSLRFWNLSESTWQCFSNYSNYIIEPFPDANVTNTTACIDCHQIYRSLSEFYIELEHKYFYHLCMDIVDAMNYTRQFWSLDLQCLEHNNHYPILAILILVISFTVAFYGGAIVAFRQSQMTSMAVNSDTSERQALLDPSSSVSDYHSTSAYTRQSHQGESS